MPGVAEPRVEAVHQHRPQYAQPGARQERHDENERCQAADRPVRLVGSVEDADIGYGRRLGHAGFVVVLLQRGVELPRNLHLPLEPSLLE